MKRIIPGIFLLMFIGVALLLNNCTQEGVCEGSLTLENPIPDTTVAVGDTLFIDLANPPVFVSSEGMITYDYLIVGGTHSGGTLNADLSIIENANDEGNFTLLLVIGEAEGEAVAELRPKDGCLENSTTFNILITK